MYKKCNNDFQENTTKPSNTGWYTDLPFICSCSTQPRRASEVHVLVHNRCASAAHVLIDNRCASAAHVLIDNRWPSAVTLESTFSLRRM